MTTAEVFFEGVRWLLDKIQFRKLWAKGLIRIAEDQTSKEIKSHTTSVIDIAQRDVKLGPHYLAWHKLTVAALRGYSRADVVGAHCEGANPDCPVIFCNFRSYAHAVKEVLDRLEHKRGSHYPIVWTLLKRPIFDWYNPFPFRSQMDKPGKLTLDWWEAYKDKNVAIRREQKDVQMRRLVAHPALPEETADSIARYCLFSEIPLTLSELATHPVPDDWEWVEPVHNVIYGDRSTQGALVHLIGKPKNTSQNKTARINLVDHFDRHFHNGHECKANDKGVFLRYLRTSAGAEQLLQYDDVFIVELSTDLAFGLAFIDDETLDVNGMRFLPQNPMREGEASGDTSLLDLLRAAWNSGQRKLVICDQP